MLIIMVIPIKPSEIKRTIPEWVIQGANECIRAHYQDSCKTSYFTQDALITYVLRYAPDETIGRKDLFDNHWLDIEPIYREVGWEVEYYKLSFYENGLASFTFKAP